MGRFFNNLKGQIGRDTGKALSGLVYGDKHATVYRRVDGSTTRKKRETDEEREERIERERIEAELSALNQDIQKRIDLIMDEDIPVGEKELSVFLRKLLTQMKTCSWKSNLSDKNKVTNRLSDAIYLKYDEALFHLINDYPLNKQLEYFVKQSKSLKKKRLLMKNIGIIGIALFILVLVISVLIFN